MLGVAFPVGGALPWLYWSYLFLWHASADVGRSNGVGRRRGGVVGCSVDSVAVIVVVVVVFVHFLFLSFFLVFLL